jgi:hypothetical protein
MSLGRWQPSIVLDVQVLVTQANRVTLMEREMGHPPRIIRGPDVCYLFHARDEARLPGLVDRWESYGIAAQVVLIPPTGGQSTRDRHSTPSSCYAPAGRDTSTLATGLVYQTGPCLVPPNHRRDTHECTHRPYPRGTRPDRTTPDRCTRARGDPVRPARNGGLL